MKKKVSKKAGPRAKAKVGSPVTGDKVERMMKWWARISFLLALVYLLISLFNIVFQAGGFTSPYYYVLYLVIYVLLILPFVFDGWFKVRRKFFKWWGRVASIFFSLMLVYLVFFSVGFFMFISHANYFLPVLVMILVYVPVYYFAWRNLFRKKEKRSH